MILECLAGIIFQNVSVSSKREGRTSRLHTVSPKRRTKQLSGQRLPIPPINAASHGSPAAVSVLFEEEDLARAIMDGKIVGGEKREKREKREKSGGPW